MPQTVYLAQCWYYDDGEIIGVYRRLASTQRWVGVRPWLRYPLKSEEFMRRSQDAVTWSTKRGVSYGVFPYQVEE